MPGDPQIDEAGCIFMLQQDINIETIPYHQNAALQVIMDLWDRKVTRAEFGQHAGTAISFYSTLAKLNVCEQLQAMIAKEPLDPEKMSNTIAELHRIANDKTLALVNIMRKLQHCPTSADTVN
jgi:hypothetical protein